MANHTKHVLLLLGTGVIGLFVAATALLFLVAGGHGWNATALSATALLLGPAGATAWSFRHVSVGKRIAVGTVVVNAVIDIAFAILTVREGLEYAADTWTHLPLLLVAWAAAWISLQALPVVALWFRHRQSEATGQGS